MPAFGIVPLPMCHYLIHIYVAYKIIGVQVKMNVIRVNISYKLSNFLTYTNIYIQCLYLRHHLKFLICVYMVISWKMINLLLSICCLLLL